MLPGAHYPAGGPLLTRVERSRDEDNRGHHRRPVDLDQSRVRQRTVAYSPGKDEVVVDVDPVWDRTGVWVGPDDSSVSIDQENLAVLDGTDHLIRVGAIRIAEHAAVVHGGVYQLL